MIGIYRIVNKVNRKCYVGQSVVIDERIDRHFRALRKDCHRNASGIRDKLQNAWNKYGEDSFYWEILEECSKDSLDEREKYWIKFYDSFNTGYNQTIGGDGGDTFTYKSDEDKRITRERRISRLSNRVYITNGSDERRVTRDEYEKIYKDSDDWKIGFSDSHKDRLIKNHKGFAGLKKTSEHNEKLRQRFKGIPLSEEHRKKLSDSHKGYVMPEEQKRKIGMSGLGKVFVNDGTRNLRIDKDCLEKFLSDNKNYVKGRIKVNG